MVGLTSEATVPVCDRISPLFNTIRVAAAVEQFLLASLKCSFDDFKGQRRRLFIDWLVLDVGSPIDDSSIGTGNSYWTLIKPESSLYWTLFSAPKSLSYIFSIFNLSKPEPLTSRNRTLLSARNHLLIKKLTLLNRM